MKAAMCILLPGLGNLSMRAKFLKKGDIIAAAVILGTCAVLFLALYVFNNGTGAYVQIEQNGAVIATLPLDTDAVYNIETSGKITNTVEIKNGEAHMSYADCPDQICANHSPVSRNGESIICLPNEVIVTVMGADGNEREIDGVAR